MPELRGQIATILAFDAAKPGSLLGFGSWSHVEAHSTDDFQERHVEIAAFAVHPDYQDTISTDGALCADQLYRTVLDDALGHQDSISDLPITLSCHIDNESGMRFWKRHGFVEVVGVELRPADQPPQPYRRLVLGKRPA